MTIVKSKVAAGKLELSADGNTFTAYSCQPTSVAIIPGSSDTGSADELEVLCGDKDTEGGSAATRTATLDITLISDFLANGLVAFSWVHAGDRVKFKWTPNSVTDAAHIWEGTVEVAAIDVGGDVNQRLTPSVSWKITALKMPPLYGAHWYLGAPVLSGVAAPTAPGDKEWKTTPDGAWAPADLAAAKAHPIIGNSGSSKPTPDFKQGEYLVLGDNSKAHYTTAAGWVAGAHA